MINNQHPNNIKILNYKFKTFRFRYLIIGICLVIGNWKLVIPTDVFAQAKIPLVVAPARTQVSLDPGESKNLLVKFFNESEAPLTGSIGVVDFIVTGKEGKPVLLDNIDYPISNQYSGASWVSLPVKKATIAPGEVLRVNYKVSVPSDAKAGGRYVAIFFESDGQIPASEQVNQQASSTSSRIVALLYIRVNGPITESAFVDVFSVPVFLQFGPVPISFEIFNKGNYHITPTGSLTLINWFNKPVDQKIIDEKNIFPDTKRVYENQLGSTWMFGKYKVLLNSAYGETGKVITATQDVWVVPVLLILAVVFGITIIVLLLVFFSNKLKARQKVLETKLEEEISEIEQLKDKFKDQLPKK